MYTRFHSNFAIPSLPPLPAFSLFIDVAKLDKAVSSHLGLDSTNDNSETKVTVCPYEGIWDAVKEAANNGTRIWV